MKLPLDTLLQLFDYASAPVFMVDTDNVIAYANRACRIAFGRSRDWIGQPASKIIDQFDLLQLIENGHSQGEVLLQDMEQTFNAEITHVPEAGTLVIMQNISHLRHAEQQKHGFVSDISQSLRSPLTAVAGYTELLERIGDLNEQQKNFVDKIILSIRSITQLINDLAELEKIQDHTDVTQQMVDMRQIVRYAADGLHEPLTAKSQNLILEMPEDSQTVKGNPVRLRQVVHNLIENAIQYTPENGKIHVKVEYEAEIVMLSVEDDGIGISSEDQARIFNRFFRSETAIRMGISSGLGLSIVRNIVRQHHGRIWVDSQLGEGARFVVALPAHKSEPHPASV